MRQDVVVTKVSFGPTIGEIRHAIRVPLHNVISSAESILEYSGTLPNKAVVSSAIRLLDDCERILNTIGSAADTKLSSVPFHEVAPDLEGAAIELLRLAEALAVESHSGDIDVSGNISKVCAAAKAFLQDVQQLKRNGNVSSPRSIAKIPVAKPAAVRGLILVVDDDDDNRDVLSRRLLRDGREVMLAEGGRQAMRMLRRYSFDLVLLDIMMPDMDGYEVLSAIKQDPALCHIPVVMITAVDEIETIARCIDMGADDYLPKPFNRTVLTARVGALLERKRLRDEEMKKAAELKTLLDQVEQQRLRSQALLENILPEAIALELRDTGSVQPMYFEDVTIVFADIVGFSLSVEQIPADELVYLLHQYFSRFDEIMSWYSLEKLKTIGDCYMYAGGLPTRSSSNPIDCVLAGIDMVAAVKELAQTCEVNWGIRIGVNTGPVIAGVVGTRKFAFDIWGNTVNFGARVESVGRPNRVNLSSSTFTRVRDFFDCEKQEKARIKEDREIDTYLVSGVSARLLSKNPDLSVRDAFAKRYQRYFRKPLTAFPAACGNSPLL
jgi:adenylate cyclase